MLSLVARALDAVEEPAKVLVGFVRDPPSIWPIAGDVLSVVASEIFWAPEELDVLAKGNIAHDVFGSTTSSCYIQQGF